MSLSHIKAVEKLRRIVLKEYMESGSKRSLISHILFHSPEAHRLWKMDIDSLYEEAIKFIYRGDKG